MSEPHTFGFQATYDPDPDWSGWKVTLPHQCDRWTISADSDYDSPVPKAQAVVRMSQFIAEAQAVLNQISEAPDAPDTDVQFGRSGY